MLSTAVPVKPVIVPLNPNDPAAVAVTRAPRMNPPPKIRSSGLIPWPTGAAAEAAPPEAVTPVIENGAMTWIGEASVLANSHFFWFRNWNEARREARARAFISLSADAPAESAICATAEAHVRVDGVK